MTYEDFRLRLNKHLPDSRQIAGDHSGAVKLAKWLNPTGANWAEPLGEIVLAMKKTLEEI